MKEVMSFSFEQVTSSLEISDNIIINYVVMGIIGIIAFKIAFLKVGEIGARGELGSFLHWIIRTIVFITIWAVVIWVINVIKFIISIPFYIWIAISLSIFLILMIIVSKSNPKSVLNKKII